MRITINSIRELETTLLEHTLLLHKVTVLCPEDINNFIIGEASHGGIGTGSAVKSCDYLLNKDLMFPSKVNLGMCSNLW